ncbi:hypothetical protein P153DRAFT_434456 [Dothidotthia symphoricarpi CBS 119687]|uniref:Uncharacterized protein n=1 Tax=Dothidotthia symphoricarpi CBS 119687 TaxID=1392245 RepID=A0A6A6A2H5_9PLEO|nr:uncharacterized protein P153DRAFT_434456 [Dothidotthia symphoricarpi CBS 119687]KAF2125383.1 hypothetical protein P153DRAFT_434456 [Dothidotthia symphoricarpi CBS 119687]
MYSIRNILVTVALLGAVPLSLGAPAPNQADAIAQYDSSEPTTQDDSLDAKDVLNVLEARAVNCGITSAPGKNCTAINCKPEEQCTVSAAQNCVWKNTNPRTRPNACLECKCYKLSS